jgi:hypothetical protein
MRLRFMEELPELEGTGKNGEELKNGGTSVPADEPKVGGLLKTEEALLFTKTWIST